MNAEIISVGTELLLGHTINTDAAFVARELSAIGVNLLFACTVGDNPGRLRDALEEALGRSDVVITTGGFGPHGRRSDQGNHRQCGGRSAEDP